jgi:hypothetical protein
VLDFGAPGLPSRSTVVTGSMAHTGNQPIVVQVLDPAIRDSHSSVFDIGNGAEVQLDGQDGNFGSKDVTGDPD